ncbi:MAG: hypothetical protein ACK4E0_18625 [Chitinophagaceae bacterium]
MFTSYCRNGFLVCFILVLAATTVQAQPFSLDQKLKPVKLQLKPYKEWKGASIAGGKGSLNAEGDYYYVKGASMFQPIDVFLIGPDNAEVKMELVKNNWQDIKKTASTADVDDGIAQLKVRTYGDFGIRVFASDDQSGQYQLVVLAAPERKGALASPFVAASNKENKSSMSDGAVTNSPTPNEESKNSSIVLYVLGAVVLILLILVFVLLRKRNKAGLLLLAMLMQLALPLTASARGRGSSVDWERLKGIMDAKKLGELQEKIKKAKDMMTSTKDLLEEYFGMGECLSMPPPPGMPNIPSFCPDLEEGALGTGGGDCATCFTEAREKFNKVRYNLEQLRIIYKCTKDFSDKAIAFGDNASGTHAVTGLAWQAERAKIEGAVKNLKDAYDKKYTELLERLQESMIELAVCEEQFGTPDWYDRYGYMFYEFVKEKYKRSGD